jgi:hypothetical protein
MPRSTNTARPSKGSRRRTAQHQQRRALRERAMKEKYTGKGSSSCGGANTMTYHHDSGTVAGGAADIARDLRVWGGGGRLSNVRSDSPSALSRLSPMILRFQNAIRSHPNGFRSNSGGSRPDSVSLDLGHSVGSSRE